MHHLRENWMVRRCVYVQNMRYLRTNRIARRRLDGVYVAKRSIYLSFAGEVQITRMYVKDALLTGQNNRMVGRRGLGGFT